MTIQTATPLLSRFSSVNAQWKETLVQDYVGKRISDLRTPSLVIDKTILEHNCKSLACISSLDVKVRVHVKTHKVNDHNLKQLESELAIRLLKVLEFNLKEQRQTPLLFRH